MKLNFSAKQSQVFKEESFISILLKIVFNLKFDLEIFNFSFFLYNILIKF